MSKKTTNIKTLPLSISQNFLTSSKTIKRLLRLTSINENDHVIEVGAGKGHITKELIKVSGLVSSFEIDCKLYMQLQKQLHNAENLIIVNQDFLKASLPSSGKYKVFSNIPFSITSEIIRKLTNAENPPQDTWLVLEKGAAKRFAGKPYETLASVAIKPTFDMKIKYHFSRQDFHPMPSVDTVLLHISKKDQPDIPAEQQRDFINFVDRVLKYGINRELTKKQIATALKLAGLPGIQESGLMLYVQWLCLFRCYRRFNGG